MASGSAYKNFRKSINLPLMEDVLQGITIVPSKAGLTAGGYSWDFSIRKDEEIRLKSDITDYFIETNDAIQDNIALRPIEFTVDGIVGEKEEYSTKVEEVISEYYISPISALGAYLPSYAREVTSAILQVIPLINQAIGILNEVAEADRTVLKFLNLDRKADEYKKQKEGLMFLLSAWASRELFTVDTPYAQLDNCAILNLTYRQPEESRTYSEVSITFKQLKMIGQISEKPKFEDKTQEYQDILDKTTGNVGLRYDALRNRPDIIDAKMRERGYL